MNGAAIFLALLLAPAVPPPITAGALVAGLRGRAETADYRMTGRIVRVNADGTRRSYNVTVKARWFPGVLRILVNVTQPASARQRILLEMRPGGNRTILVARPGDATPRSLPFAQWTEGILGSDFSYEDLLEPQFFWPGQKLKEETQRGARTCEVLESTPGAERSHYAEVRTWLDKSIDFPVYAEKTLKLTGAQKEFTYMGIRREGGVWSASQVQVSSRGSAALSLFIIERGSAKANLGAKDFEPDAMARF